MQEIGASEHCDWWITREASIIDVPGKYLSSAEAGHHQHDGAISYPMLWQFFLQLIKKHRSNDGLDGIIIALPVPEILKSFDAKAYQATLLDLFQRIHEMRKLFPQPVSCQIIITKCDLLPGFSEFFAESSNEEITQAWGITLPTPN